MNIGIPKEVKRHEYRVSATPGAVRAFVAAGHRVAVETGAGEGSSFSDADYEAQGAHIVDSAAAWSQAMVLKVKEPVKQEFGFLRDDLLLFTYLHLAADRPLTERLLEAGTTAIAYETVQLQNGALPLLTPMSEVAGRMAPQVGAYHLERFLGGRGLLLGGVPGVEAGEVVILGGGVVGTNAAENRPRTGGAGDDFGHQPRTLAVSGRYFRRARADPRQQPRQHRRNYPAGRPARRCGAYSGG